MLSFMCSGKLSHVECMYTGVYNAFMSIIPESVEHFDRKQHLINNKIKWKLIKKYDLPTVSMGSLSV